MLSPDEIQRLCERKYPAFLSSLVSGERFFPLEIRFGRPSTTDEWEKLRGDISTLARANIGYRIEWAETNTRRWGRQKFPTRVWFECEDDYLSSLRKRPEVQTFRTNLALTRAQCPELGTWLPSNAIRLADFAETWPDLLKVCRYFLSYPRPGLYARELPVEVDTKFIERHEGILRNLLDFLLPDSAKVEADRFEERFGLRYDEPLIRFRLLDPQLKLRLNLPVDDLAVPLSRFCAWNWTGLRVIVTENKMRTTFLTLPSAPDAIGIWGGGGAAELLSRATWLANCRLFYWGDLDVHGFHILSRLRRTFPQITSVMMDETTLDTFSRFIVAASESTYEMVSGLTAQEHRAYKRVQAGTLLLEQEKIPHSYAAQMLCRLLTATAIPSPVSGVLK
jgi:hypothetical protein